jgi:hypothetical protein
MALEGQAERAGGRVHALIGNHEAMNIIGDLRYVAKEAYAAYATPKSEEVRERAYRDYVKHLSERAARLKEPAATPAEAFKQRWLAARPPGYFEHRRAFAADGKYGRWISGHQAVVKINGTVFLHGGISEELSAKGISEINERVRQELGGFSGLRSRLARDGVIKDFFNLDETLAEVKKELAYLKALKEPPDPKAIEELELLLSVGGWYISHPTGPLWLRAYASEAESSFEAALGRILSNLNARKLVVGHTPSAKGITPRFSGKVWLIDTGMLRKHYQGRCSALLIEGEKFTPVYPTGGPCS